MAAVLHAWDAFVVQSPLLFMTSTAVPLHAHLRYRPVFAVVVVGVWVLVAWAVATVLVATAVTFGGDGVVVGVVAAAIASGAAAAGVLSARRWLPVKG